MSKKKSEDIVINSYDINAVKQLLDDEIRQVVVNKLDFEEDVVVNNFRLFFGVISCILAVVGHFFPEHSPVNRPVLFLCVGGYFILSLATKYLTTHFEKDFVLFTHPRKELGIEALSFAIVLTPYDEKITIRVVKSSVASKKLENLVSGIDYFELKTTIANYFDSQGKFFKKPFEKDIVTLVQKMLKQNKFE
eukprot:GCRY01001593.1.p1 GENE.GCRY01001593.1~~GCRY01001593.1.p1  ORF type:complete len:192 (-),score=21.07 GCRY01001593.1:187-762(-)